MTQQQGHLFKSHSSWFVRYREQVKRPDGSVGTVQRAQRLASLSDYPKKSEVMSLKNEFMAKLNRTGFTPEAGACVVDFVERIYFPEVETRLADSTVRGYREAWRHHLKDRVAGVRVRDFRTVDGETLMRNIERERGEELAHGTYRHIKVTLSAIFTHAKRVGIFDGVNPMQNVSIPKGKKHGRKRLAYSLEEIEQHLDLFRRDPIVIRRDDGSLYTPQILAGVVRAVIGVGAFAGLREG